MARHARASPANILVMPTVLHDRNCPYLSKSQRVSNETLCWTLVSTLARAWSEWLLVFLPDAHL